MTAAFDLLERVPSVLIFLLGLTVVAECVAIVGLFDLCAHALITKFSGQVRACWLGLMLISVIVTAFLSLDTTAVLITSAAITVARRLERPPLVFAFPVLWIANMSSLWLPTSNLTNLLARHVLQAATPSAYFALAAPLAAMTTLVPIALAYAFWRHDLRGRVHITENPMVENRAALRDVAAVVILMSIGLLFLEPAAVSSAAALAAVAIVALRMREHLSDVSLPWRSMAITIGLFVAVAILRGSGALTGIIRLNDAPDWLLALSAALAANIANNLPAYLAFEPAAHGDDGRVMALLIGVNVASGITWWGSVATLLWRERLHRDGVDIPLKTHLKYTGAATIITTVAALLVR